MNPNVDLHRDAVARARQLYRAARGRCSTGVGFFGALLGLSFWSCVGPADADVASLPDAPQRLVRARLVAESTSLQRDHSGWLAVQLTMKPGWHTYWRNPGDSGLATSIKWILPQGVKTSPIIWPRPDRFTSRSIVGYGYSADVALLTKITVPSRFASGRIIVGASVSWLACSDVCIPGSETLKLTLPVSNTVPKADPARVGLFAETRRRVPRLAPFEATFTMDQDSIHLRIPGATVFGVGKLSAAFYPFASSVIDHGAPQSAFQDKQRIELTLRRGPASSGQLDTLDGLLVIEERAESNVQSSAFDVSARRARGASDPPPAR